jgi:O-antigen ligase
LALALAAQGSVQASPLLWSCALAALAGALACQPGGAARVWSLPALAVVLLAAWIASTNRWLNPSYTAAAPFHAAFLLGGFLLGSRTGAARVAPVFAAALVFAVALAGWGVWQGIHGGERAHALFETPSTLAAVLNLVLLPVLVLALAGNRRPALLLALAVLIAGVAATSSRSGWISLGAGIVAVLLFSRKLRLGLAYRAIAVLAGMFVAAWLAIPGAPSLSLLASGSSLARLELYDLAWRSIERASLLPGIGYTGFFYVLEGNKSAVWDYERTGTYFVHNDYLQFLLELGVVGWAGLLAITLAPIAVAWRAATPGAIPPGGRATLVASAAALVSMALHAAMDFPFYVPVCLLMYGFGLGIVASVAAPGRAPEPRSVPGRVAIAAAATLGAWLLAMPLAAELAAWHAQRAWARGEGVRAAYWFETARVLEPRDWRYHWYAGQYWTSQALTGGRPEAARRALEAFSRGSAVNPREARNRTAGDAARRDLAHLLRQPARGAP